MLKVFFFFCLFSCSALLAVDNAATNRMLFLMQSGRTSSALQLYQESYKQSGKHDMDLIQKMALILLEQGYRSGDPETQLLTIYGAGISLNEKTIYILEDAVKGSHPELQLIALNFLSTYQNDYADAILNKALGSDYLLIRLEGAFLLAERQYPTALGQAEALMCKVDPKILPVFPPLFAMIGTPPAMKVLRKLLANSNELVRISAILSVAEYQRDDMLPAVRNLASHHAMLQQEACAKTLGDMKDTVSIPQLEVLTRASKLTARLAAFQALYKLGKQEVRQKVEAEAKTGNLFAIHLLGEMQGSENTLFELTRNTDLQIRVNATLALLERQDPRCLKPLQEVLVRDARDLVFQKISSDGHALEAYKVIPSAQQNFEEDATAFEISLEIRENALSKARDLPEKYFIQLAQAIFEVQQNDLVPILVALLENLQTQDAIALLKKYQQKAGAPLIRNYCTLGLYRLREEGPHAENLKTWIAQQQNNELIRFRPLVPWDGREHESLYQLTPQETSRLLIEAFEALAASQEDIGINVLLHAIQNGNNKNKYALAGLLMRAAQ
jgi:HEAT repeat protein